MLTAAIINISISVCITYLKNIPHNFTGFRNCFFIASLSSFLVRLTCPFNFYDTGVRPAGIIVATLGSQAVFHSSVAVFTLSATKGHPKPDKGP